MSAYLLVRANNLFGPFIEGETPPIIDPKGGVIEARMQADGQGSAEKLPTFVRINCNLALETVENYQKSWNKSADWSVVSNDAAVDSYRLSIKANNPGAGQGNITSAEIDRFLSDWNFSVFSESVNEVVVDISVYAALTSRGFWGDIADIAIFSELNYNPATGVHQIQADYSSLTRAASKWIDQNIRNRGGVIISHTGKIVVFEMDRADVVAKLKTELQQITNQPVLKRRYQLSAGIVDQAIAAGGELTLTPTELQAALIDLSA